MSDRKPNWDKWKLIPNAVVWQVAALSLDIDPDKVEHHPQGWMAGGYITLEGQDFKDRVEVIAANANNDKNNLLYLVTLNQNGKEYCQINIANFAKWAKSNNVSLPTELAALASNEDEAIKPVAEKPLSTRTENNYLRLIMALANGIKDFNPTKPYEAAKLIIDETGIEKISQQTIADYISKAHALDSKEKG